MKSGFSFYTMNLKFFFLFAPMGLMAQNLSPELADNLVKLPIKCIPQQYPNKPSHTYNNIEETRMEPRDFHPSFYGCFDWHSSVHGHWMLVRSLRHYPNLKDKEQILSLLSSSFKKENLVTEAEYFSKFALSKNFERTYGWAWLLKLDEELSLWKDPKAKEWRENLQPLVNEIAGRWEAYLHKQPYPNRTGVHSNSAFALSFFYDWAKSRGDEKLLELIHKKTQQYYGEDRQIPAHLEPNGTDFFSPSLLTASLISRQTDTATFTQWFSQYFSYKGLNNVTALPVITDTNDYQIVHLVGLYFSRAWCIRDILKKLPKKHPQRKALEIAQSNLLKTGLTYLEKGGYGGDHWLGSFATYALLP